MITSHQNQLLKEIRKLNTGKRDAGRFVAEGEDLVEEAAAAGWEPIHLLRAGKDVTEEALAKVSALGSGSRVLGVYEERFAAPAGPLCVALWGVKDPGNVGTVIRSALAFGASSVALGPDTAVASTLFRRESAPGRVGRQMQVWVRTSEGWRVAAAHVSVIDEPQPSEAT